MKNMDRKRNWPVVIGSFATAIYLLTKDMTIIPDSVSGFILGIGLGGNLIGLFIMNCKTSKFSEWKKSLIAKLINR